MGDGRVSGASGPDTPRAMRRVIRKRIHRTGQGIDLVADLNVDLSVNTGTTSSRSRTQAGVPEGPRTSEASGPDGDAQTTGEAVDPNEEAP